MSPAPRPLLLPLLLLAAALAAPLRAQPTPTMVEREKKEKAETLRLAASSTPKDRILALLRLFELHHMADYDLHWKLMNDADMEVRIIAIGEVQGYFNSPSEVTHLPKEMAQKMMTMLEQEVAPQRISAAFAPGPVKELPAGLVLSSALELARLYTCHHFSGCIDDYTLWQQRVLQPLAVILASRNAEIPAAAIDFHSRLLNAISDPATLMEVLRVTMNSMDSPGFPPDRLEQTLRDLWQHHRLLGQGRPLNLMLVARLSPRLEGLKPRILGRWKNGPGKDYAAKWINEITAAAQEAREKLAPQSAKAAAGK